MPKHVTHLASAAPLALSPEQDDVTLIVDVADCIIPLPSAGAETLGNRVLVLVSTLSTTIGCSLSPQAADSIRGTGITSVANKDLINSHGTDALGDSAELVSDGQNSWWITNLIGTWAIEG